MKVKSISWRLKNENQQKQQRASHVGGGQFWRRGKVLLFTSGEIWGYNVKNKLRSILLNIGKLILDITKLCFGSFVLGAAIRGEIPQDLLMLLGIIVSTIGAVIGIFLVTLGEEK
jgi:hypothetical protein